MSDFSNHKLGHLGFVRVEPSDSLKPYIDSYWFIDATCTEPQGYQEFLHPDGGMGFIFNYGDALSFNGLSKQSDAFLDGTNTKTIQLGLTEKINAVGIRFKPAGAAAFLDRPLHELKNQQLDLADLNIKLYFQLYHQLPEQKNIPAKVSIIEQALYKTRVPGLTISPGTFNAIKHVKDSQGRWSIKTLSQELDIGQRKLERLFKSQLGMSAVDYTKSIRIEHARNVLKITDVPLAEVAYKLGFFDQSHFSRSFKSVVGITPGQYRIISQSGSAKH